MDECVRRFCLLVDNKKQIEKGSEMNKSEYKTDSGEVECITE